MGYRNGITHLSAPRGHTVYTGQETAHQKEDHYEEIGDEHSLQLRISISGDEQSEAENRDEIHYSKGIQGEQTACGEDAVYYIHYRKPQGEENEPHYQKGNELA